MITMATYTQWLKEQEGRDSDPVGWFAQFWRDLPDKPRLSAPASITKYLEDRDLFRLTPGLTEAHDATLAEYRRQREGVVRAVATEAGVDVPQPDEKGLAGQQVDHATRMGLEAAQRHAQPHEEPSQLDRIEAMLSAITRHLGLAVTDVYGPVIFQPLDWDAMYQQAAVYATAHGPGWDEVAE